MTPALTQDAGARVNKYSIQGALHIVIEQYEMNRILHRLKNINAVFEYPHLKDAVAAGFGCTSYAAIQYRLKNKLSVQAFNKDNFLNRLSDKYPYPTILNFAATFDFDINSLLDHASSALNAS